MSTPDFLTIRDLYNKVGEKRVIEFFDDDRDGDIDDASEVLAYQQIMQEAEAEAYNRMLRSYTDVQTIIDLAAVDPGFVGHVAWVALEFASQRRMFNNAGDGGGAFSKQYDRAIEYFENLSKGRRRSKGEATVGQSGNVGGEVQPAADTGDHFTFATERDSSGNRKVHGGF
jgi:hypothetical protein